MCVLKTIIAVSTLFVILATLSLIGNYASYPHLAMFSPSESFYIEVGSIISFAISTTVYCLHLKADSKESRDPKVIRRHEKIRGIIAGYQTKASSQHRLVFNTPHAYRNFHYALAKYTEGIKIHGNAQEKKDWKVTLQKLHEKKAYLEPAQESRPIRVTLNCSTHIGRLESNYEVDAQIEKFDKNRHMHDLGRAYSEEYELTDVASLGAINTYLERGDLCLVAHDTVSGRVLGGLFIQDLSLIHGRKGTFMIHSVCKRSHAVRIKMADTMNIFLSKEAESLLGTKITTLYARVLKSDAVAISAYKKLGFVLTEHDSEDHCFLIKS
jgi:hypothetical protein